MAQIIVDMSNWTQEEKNYLQAGAVALLFQAGIIYDNISTKDGVIDVVNPSADISPITSNLKTFIDAQLEANRIASLEAQKEAQARETEVSVSELRDIKLAQVDAKIDAISNLSELKVFLKKLTRFIIARI